MKCKEFFKKYGVIIIIFIFSISPIILNFFFFITDISAGKEVKCGEIFYSSISNENWLDFWGTFMPALAAFSFLYFTKKQTESIKKQVEFEKNKYEKDKRIEAFEKNVILELDEIRTAKKIIYDFLVELDIPDIDFSIKNDEEYTKKIKKINIKFTAVDFLTYLRLKDSNKEIDTQDEQSLNIEKMRKEGYERLTILHELYTSILEKAYKKTDDKKIFENLKEVNKFSKEKIDNLENLSYDKILEIYNQFYNKTLNVLLGYFYLREDKIKHDRIIINYDIEKNEKFR